MSIWDDIKNKGKELASEAMKSAIPTVTEKIGDAVNSVISGKKEDKKK